MGSFAAVCFRRAYHGKPTFQNGLANVDLAGPPDDRKGLERLGAGRMMWRIIRDIAPLPGLQPERRLPAEPGNDRSECQRIFHRLTMAVIGRALKESGSLLGCHSIYPTFPFYKRRAGEFHSPQQPQPHNQRR